MGVDVQRLEGPAALDAEPLDRPVAAFGELRGEGNTYLLDPRDNRTAILVNKLLESGETVYRVDAPVPADGGTLPPGAFLVAASSGLSERLADMAAEAGADVIAVEQRIRGSGWEIEAPRVALYEPWTASMDAGWTRYVLEQYGFPYSVLRDADVRKGGLESRFDAIVLPSESARELVEGNAEGLLPVRYTGGLGDRGIAALRAFANGGGTIVALDDAADVALDHLGANATDALAEVGRDEFFCPGSLLRIEVDNTHPLAYGMPASATAFFVRSQGFAIPDNSEEPSAVTVVARYADDNLLESGWILGAEHLGAGRVVLLGFRTHFRAQSHGTFKLFFNSLWHAAAARSTLP